MSKIQKDNIDYEIINGLKVAKSLPEKQKEAIRNDSNEGGDPNFDPERHVKNLRTRITLSISCDLLEKIRDEAEMKSLPYQTFINQLLAEAIQKNSDKSSTNVEIWAEIIYNLTNELKIAHEELRNLKAS
jgi:predicted DNA binding CopG/RHH family protein